MTIVYLGLGSNLGDRKLNLAQAVELISRHVEVQQLSSIYETEPVGYSEQPLFLNAVLRIATQLSPRRLLKLVKEIEAASGRIPSFPNAPRPLDIDILFYGNKVVSSPKLTIPHPRLTERAFVLVPLAELAPEMLHPESGKTVRELINDLGTISGVYKWAEAEELVNRRHDVPSVR